MSTDDAAAFTLVHSILPEKISECALVLGDTPTCTSAKTQLLLAEKYSVPAANVIDALKQKLSCNTERCVLEHAAAVIGPIAYKEISLNLKIRGPTDNTLLNNINIDETLARWVVAMPWFYAYNFNMLNYTEYSFRNGQVVAEPDTLATVQFIDVYNKSREGTNIPITCGACVVNTDRYQGRGRHWIGLFIDCRASPFTIEFFNSSGRAPSPEWVNWMEKTKSQFIRASHEAITVKATAIRQQESMTECGLYSLFYIWARLHDVPHDFFAKHKIHDKFMFEFRQHLFDDPSRPRMTKFNWEEYRKKTALKWEAGARQI